MVTRNNIETAVKERGKATQMDGNIPPDRQINPSRKRGGKALPIDLAVH
jgi:hypothetical protein